MLCILGVVFCCIDVVDALTLNASAVTFRNGGIWYYPTGIDYNGLTNTIVTSAYTNNAGRPNSLMRIDSLGNQIAYGNVTALWGEVMFFVVPPGLPAASPWPAGDLYVGGTYRYTNVTPAVLAGSIIRVSADGTAYNPWCAIPGALQITLTAMDTTGLFNYSLFAVTRLNAVYRVSYGPNGCSGFELFYQFPSGMSCEALLVVPNDPVTYGNFAGKLLAGAHDRDYYGAFLIYDRVVQNFTLFRSYNFSVEDIDIIVPNFNYFGINRETNRIISADYTQFASVPNRLLLTGEAPGALALLSWPLAAPAPIIEEITVNAPAGTFIGMFEQSAFAPAGVMSLLPYYFELCLQLTSTSGPTVPITPLTLSAQSQAISQYAYNQPRVKSYNGDTLVPSQAGTALMWLSRDYQNTFSLTMLFDKADRPGGGTGGSITVALNSPSIDGSVAAPSTQQQDDPANMPDTATPDTYVMAGGVGKFTFSWSPTTTDGVVVSPIDFVGASPFGQASSRFRMSIALSDVVNITQWFFVSQNASRLVYIPISLSDTLTIGRLSCHCGNNIVEKYQYEECDGGACCSADCSLLGPQQQCRAASDVCATNTYCDGVSSTCPAEVPQPSTQQCRASAGVCDPAEFCSGLSMSCPADAKANTSQLCAPSVTQCVLNAYCSTNASYVDSCPPNQINGTCVYDLCHSNQTSLNDTSCTGLCGDGVLQIGEECDYNITGSSVCCTTQCTFVRGTDNLRCRGSSAVCDPPEFCSGTSAACPADVSNQCPQCALCLAGGTCMYTQNAPGTQCVCDPRHTGDGCGLPLCNYTSCGECSTDPECGWCCAGASGLGSCRPGDDQDSDRSVYGTCSAPQLVWNWHQCNCSSPCFNGGTCSCSMCNCPAGFGGADCFQVLGCDGQYYGPTSGPNGTNPAPQLDACGICGGNGSSCIGCDGRPFGLHLDVCGVCGGNGSTCTGVCQFDDCDGCVTSDSACSWCLTNSKCYSPTARSSGAVCAQWSTGGQCSQAAQAESPVLTVAEAVGLGAGIIAAIVIGVVIGVALFGFGGKKLYDYFLTRDTKMRETQNNPLYQETKNAGSNPMYDGQ